MNFSTLYIFSFILFLALLIRYAFLGSCHDFLSLSLLFIFVFSLRVSTYFCFSEVVRCIIRLFVIAMIFFKVKHWQLQALLLNLALFYFQVLIGCTFISFDNVGFSFWEFNIRMLYYWHNLPLSLLPLILPLSFSTSWSFIFCYCYPIHHTHINLKIQAAEFI